MLTTYDRALREWRRRIRLEATLSYRESDRRVPGEGDTWTRYRGMETAEGEEPSRRLGDEPVGQHADHEEESHDRA